MKKISNGEVELLQVETEEEINEIITTNGLVLFKDERGILRCCNYIEQLEVYYDDSAKKWIPTEYSFPNDSYEDVPFNETWELLKSENRLPLEGLYNARKQVGESYRNKIEEQVLKSSRKVIGWAEYDGVYFEEENQEKCEECIAALIKDIRSKGYFFAGDQFLHEPIFDGYKTLHLSERGMGEVMANSLGKYEPMDYVDYAWAVALSDEDFDKTVCPPVGPYEEKAAKATLDEETFHGLFSLSQNFKKTRVAKAGHPYAIFLLPLSDKSNFWTKEGIILINEETKQEMSLSPIGYYVIESIAQFDELLELLKDMHSESEGKPYFAENRPLVMHLLKKGRVTILSIKCE